MATTKLSDSGTLGNKYENLSADNNYMETIASTLLASSASSITFSNIPQGYKHLQIRCSVRSDRASANSSAMSMQFNSDNGSNYVGHYLFGNGATSVVGAGFDTASNKTNLTVHTASTAESGNFSPVIFDILDYSNNNKNKTVRSLSGYDINAAGAQYIWYASMLWLNISAISSIKLFDYNAANFVQYSHISLYGIKG